MTDLRDTRPITTPAPPASEPVPQLLGPDSVTWKFFGGWHGMLIGLWSGSMQNMHPKLGAAVWEHSDFFGERWERLMRSLYPIIGVVFDGTEDTGREVRDYHREIKGAMPDGSRYHALDPDVFYWAHATFWYGNIRCAEVFGPPITEADKRQLFEESRTWYAMYGVSTRPSRIPTRSSSSTGMTCAATSSKIIPPSARYWTSPNCRRPRGCRGCPGRSGNNWSAPPNGSSPG